MELIVRLTTSWLMERHIDVAKGLVYLSMENAHYLYIIIGYRNTQFFPTYSVKNIRFNGFFLTESL
jgi:hypothetical protein